MFSLLRFAFSLVVFAILIWFATMVPLGKHTLWQHLRAISGTKEAKELAEGTEEEARKVAKRIMQKDGGAPDLAQLDEVDEHDRRRLDQMTQKQATQKPTTQKKHAPSH
jgi:hypothetical protein